MPAPVARLLLGLALVYALFHGSATMLGSDRGQAGLVVGALVVGALLVVERVAFGRPIAVAARELGLGRSRGHGLAVAAGVSGMLLLVFPAYAGITGRPLTLDPRWATFVPGLFSQAGIAEETLFRGYLFRHVRQGRAFWPAVGLAALPFVAVHLVLFATMPWPIALASVLLSVVISAPLAHLFELAGNTVWAPALLHFVVQGAIKLVTPAEPDPQLALAWMAAAAVAPYAAFLVRRPAVNSGS